MATCNTPCTRSSTSGRRRTTATSTAGDPAIRQHKRHRAGPVSWSRSIHGSASPIGPGKPGEVPLQGRDALPIHVDEITAEIFAAGSMTDKPQHGGLITHRRQAISMRRALRYRARYCPIARRSVSKRRRAARRFSGNYLIDKTPRWFRNSVCYTARTGAGLCRSYDIRNQKKAFGTVPSLGAFIPGLRGGVSQDLLAGGGAPCGEFGCCRRVEAIRPVPTAYQFAGRRLNYTKPLLLRAATTKNVETSYAEARS